MIVSRVPCLTAYRFGQPMRWSLHPLTILDTDICTSGDISCFRPLDLFTLFLVVGNVGFSPDSRVLAIQASRNLATVSRLHIFTLFFIIWTSRWVTCQNSNILKTIQQSMKSTTNSINKKSSSNYPSIIFLTNCATNFHPSVYSVTRPST